MPASDSNFNIVFKMISKIFLVLAALQLTYTNAADVDNVNIDIETATCVENEIKIQHTILTKMSTYTKGLWDITPQNQNIQFFPLLDTISKNIALIEVYYENGLNKVLPQNRFLEEPFELAKLLDRLQQTSDVKLKFENAVFVDMKHIFSDYIYDVTSYYHSNAYAANLDPKDSNSMENMVHKWMSEKTRNRKPKKENLLMPGLTHFHTSALHYTACWNSPMIVEEPQLFTLYRRVGDGDGHQRRRRFISTSKFPTLNFDNLPKAYVDAIGYRNALKYYNNTQLGYEAISIPYRGNEFFMAVVLPHENRSLDMFVNFTAEDYFQILEHLGDEKNYQFIRYVIPALNLSMVSVNENGTSVNQNDPDNCGPSIGWNVKPKYKPFIVDRPYGLFIYHERTKFVLWQAWIRDPVSSEYVPRRFLNHTNPIGEEIDRRHIS